MFISSDRGKTHAKEKEKKNKRYIFLDNFCKSRGTFESYTAKLSSHETSFFALQRRSFLPKILRGVKEGGVVRGVRGRRFVRMIYISNFLRARCSVETPEEASGMPYPRAAASPDDCSRSACVASSPWSGGSPGRPAVVPCPSGTWCTCRPGSRPGTAARSSSACGRCTRRRAAAAIFTWLNS